LEHTADPLGVLANLRSVLSPRGVMLVSVPNFAHWYPRVRVALGRFDYDRRGILDATHLRFFTRASFERLAQAARMGVRQITTTALPIEVGWRGTDTPVVAERLIGRVDRACV